jgi:TetR/AcrR family transcriptional repressor of nem operon
MGDAGLTNGAFYAHFESKDQLVATAITDQLRRQAVAFGTFPADRAGLEQFIREYLSTEHRDNPAEGCPSDAVLEQGTRNAIALIQ